MEAKVEQLTQELRRSESLAMNSTGTGPGGMIAANVTEAPLPISRDWIVQFFHYVYPILPLFHRPSFIATLESQCKATLAVMYALGHRYHRQPQAAPDLHAADAFYERAKKEAAGILNNTSLGSVRLAILLSLYASLAGQSRAYWLYQSLATRMAFLLRLHFQDDPSFAALSPIDHELRRRLWWVCFVTDRAISLVGIPVPCQMTDEHYPVPLPVPELSFDHPQANDLLLQLRNSSAGSESMQQRSLFSHYIVEMNILGKIGDFQKREAKGQFVQSQYVYLSEALRDWLDSLPLEYQSVPGASELGSWSAPPGESIWTLFTLHFLYQASHIHLNLSRFFYRLGSLSTSESLAEDHLGTSGGGHLPPLLNDPSVTACFQAARSVAGLCKVLDPVNPFSVHLNPLVSHIKFMAGWVQSWILSQSVLIQQGLLLKDWALAAGQDLQILQDSLMLE